MFKLEAEMTPVVVRWLEQQQLIVKAEFTSPSGICDLVGLAFDQRHVKLRTRNGQYRSLGSEFRASLFLAIPDRGSEAFLTVDQLLAGYVAEDHEYVKRHLSNLISDRFVVCDDGRLERINGWLPLHRRIVAVELKLNRFSEVIQQAQSNQSFADESYIAIPADVVTKSRMRLLEREAFESNGLGLLAVSRDRCEVVRKAKRRNSKDVEPRRVYCVEKFWRTHLKDTSSKEEPQ